MVVIFKKQHLFSVLFALGAIDFFASFFGVLFGRNPSALYGLLLAPIAAAPYSVILILNYKKRKKLEHTDEKFLPKITFDDPAFEKRASQENYDPQNAPYDNIGVEFLHKEWDDANRDPGSGEWKCPSCWKLNKNSVDICDCGSERPR